MIKASNVNSRIVTKFSNFSQVWMGDLKRDMNLQIFFEKAISKHRHSFKSLILQSFGGSYSS